MKHAISGILALTALLIFALAYLPFTVALQRLLQLGGVILLLDAVILYLRQYARESYRYHFFPAAIALSSTILLIGYRYIFGVGIGLERSGPFLPSGILFNAMDNYSYGAWITQAKQGQLTFFDLYTVDPHEPIYFNFLFLTLGTIARWLDAPSLAVLILAGIVASAVLILIAFYVPIRAGLPERAAKWSCVLAAFSSGISVTLNLIGRSFGVKTPPGADLRYQDAILFSSYYSYPYNTISFCLLAVLVLLIVVYEQKKLPAGDRFFPFFLVSMVALILNFTHPYEGPLLLLAYGIYSTVYFISHPKEESSSRFWILTLLFVSTAVATIYNFWVSRHPVWNNFAHLSLSLPAKRSFWILGYGLLLPASILGAWISFKKIEFEKIRWMGIIPIATAVLLIVIAISQTKVLTPAYFFMCIMAGVFCQTVQDRIGKITSVIKKKVVSAFAILLVPFFFLNSILILLFFLDPLFYDAGLPEAAMQIRSFSKSENPLVLCDSNSGMSLPVLSGARVYAGHAIMTPLYEDKKRLLIEAGFDPPRSGKETIQLKSFIALLQSAPFEFVLVDKNRAAYFFTARIKQLRLVDCYEQKCLFATPFVNRSDQR